jgi:YegS/Rv2252/BmrU family lipid kinase
MEKLKIILNPVAGRGYSGRAEPRIRQFLKEAGVEFDLVLTEYRGHGIELAEQATKEGYKYIVAVGGDGTANEVINGMVAASDGRIAGILGLLATGSASDFTYSVGIPQDLKQACYRLAQKKIRTVDLGKVTLPGEKFRYFDNQLGIGFDGVVTIESQKFKRLRGMALYFPVVLKTIFLTNKATQVTIQYDDKKIELPTLQISVANGSREGGGFYLAPQAKIDDGFFDLFIVGKIGKLSMLGLIPKFMKGTHVNYRATTMVRAKRVTVTSEDDLIAHIDGEIICTQGHEIKCEIVPQRLQVMY